ncbi:MAG TPA: SRPBCC family protein [Chryseosolibacter sp.]
MSANFISKATVTIDAPAAKVWHALTSPEMIREYLFGTQVETDWRIGSDIVWRGEYQGQSYEDKGKILQVLPDKLLQHTYHSSMSAIEDQPENYFNVTYELEESDGQTTVTLTTSNLPDENSVEHSEKNWQGVLMKLKDVVERQPENVS